MYKNNVILLPKVQKYTKSISPLVSKAKNDGTMILSKGAVCSTKKSKNKKQKDH